MSEYKVETLKLTPGPDMHTMPVNSGEIGCFLLPVKLKRVPKWRLTGQFKQQRFWTTHVNRKWAFFSLLIRLDATKFVWLSVCTLIETTCPNFFSKSRLKSAKSPFPVDVRHSKTWLLELRRNVNRQLHWVPSVNTPPFYWCWWPKHQFSCTKLEQPHIRLKPGEHVRNDATGDLKLTWACPYDPGLRYPSRPFQQVERTLNVA